MTEQRAPASVETIPPSRRHFLGWVIGGISSFIAATVGIPAIGAVVAVLDRRTGARVRLNKLVDYPLGQPSLAQFTIARTDGWLQTVEGRSVWVMRTGEQQVTVFNGRCTHLGCAYSWRTQGANSEHFVCPCHDGVFALDGSVVAGPPPRPLDTLPVTIEQGVIVVTYQDFRSGVREKTPT